MDIDFVVLWVNGSDPAWIEEFNKYSPKKKAISIDVLEERYRDNGLLRYWFRGVEANAPWASRIYFVTNGQKPEWINLENEKLRWIKHEDFIPHEYLPTFNCNPIHMHLHRINDLSENFILFDDDMYLLNPIEKDYYFKNYLPSDYAILRPLKIPDFFSHLLMNNMIEINKHFSKNEVIKGHFFKYFNYRYGLKHFIPAYYAPNDNNFPGFLTKHFSQPYLKKTFEDVWTHCEEILRATSSNRFRTIADVTQYLFRYWQLAKGEFFPEAIDKQRKKYNISISNKEQAKKTIKNRQIKELCLNDTDCPDEVYTELLNHFEEKFPNKSSFEI